MNYLPDRHKVLALCAPFVTPVFKPALISDSITRLEDADDAGVPCVCTRCGCETEASAEDTWFMFDNGAWFRMWKQQRAE
jgi:hypothetical protein